ncbi:type II secretion system protein GspJ [Planctomycetota bacterium]
MGRKKRTAFTILELLVALSMLVLILAAVYGSYSAATTSIVNCKPRSVLQQQAGLFLQRMSSELRCCYAGSSNEARGELSESRPGDEVIEQEKQPLFVGNDPSSGQTFLQFVIPTLVSKRSYISSGLATVSYKLDKSGRKLLRSEHRYAAKTEDDDNVYDWLPVFANVKTITIEYFEGEKWQEEWDSNEMNGLPQAVKISLVLETEETGPLSFMSTAHITCGGYQSPAVAVQRTALGR